MSSPQHLVLASGSPRRRALLHESGLSFEIHAIDVDESYPEDMEASKVPEFLAGIKNKAARVDFPSAIIISADTIVSFNDVVLGKPKDMHEAIGMLKLLSGKVHSVISGVCISSDSQTKSFSSTTKVKFKELSDDEISYYIETYKPYDKAGSYAIQEWIGTFGIEWIEGNYQNVVGLPILEVCEVLKRDFEVSFLSKPQEMV